MTTNDVGRIPQAWLDNLEIGSDYESVSQLISSWINCDCDVEADGTVWALGGWLDQEKIDELMERIGR